ncbi:MAG: preprotein translocase subunit YajC [Clostridiaceae bacterium]|jgi:preprotein translocase subunit YajC|nr:preprotein translocase subunit YajC [Clostridiaceae bacterium]
MIFTVALTEAGPGGIEQILSLIVPLALMFGLMYLLLIRPQRKKEKKLREQIDAMVVGDQVITIGGIVGKIVNIKDDEITISTSVANTLVTFKKSSINTVVKPVSE